MVCEGLGILGIEFNEKKNRSLDNKGGYFNKERSRSRLLVIPTDEELEIALQTESISRV